jgi:hypothetical protein
MTTDADHNAFIDWHERAELWRKRAEQMRLIAGSMSDMAARGALMRQASQWAAMAEEAEGLAIQWQKKADEATHKH